LFLSETHTNHIKNIDNIMINKGKIWILTIFHNVLFVKNPDIYCGFYEHKAVAFSHVILLSY